MSAMELADGSIIELAAAKSIQHLMLDYNNRLQWYTANETFKGTGDINKGTPEICINL